MTYAQRVMLIVVIVLLGGILLVALITAASRKKHNREKGKTLFASYYNGAGTTRGLTLTMTLVTTYLSAGTLIGGPGLAYEKGFAWAFLAILGVPAVFLALGVLGKRLGMEAEKTNAATVGDILRDHYKSRFLVIFSAITVVLFFVVQMAAQIRGAAVLFQTVTGVKHETALLLFAFLVLFVTALGSFTGQSVVGTFLGLIAVIGCFILLTLIGKAVDFGSIPETMDILHPGWDSIFGADGSVTYPVVISFMVLIGFGALGLPQTTVGGLAYRNTKALHKAITNGTIILGFIVISIHVVGALSPLLISEAEVKVLLGASAGTDYILPGVILKYCNPLTAGFLFTIPLAAILSGVSGILLSASASLVKDIYANYILKDKKKTEDPSFRHSLFLATFLLNGILVFAAWSLLQIPYFEQQSIVRLNLTAIGGIETVLLFPLLGALFSGKGTKNAAIASATGGPLLYLILTFTETRIGGFLPIVPALLFGGLLYVLTPKAEKLAVLLEERKKKKENEITSEAERIQKSDTAQSKIG